MLSSNHRRSKWLGWIALCVFTLVGVWGCNTTDPAKVYMDIKLDTSWLAYDSIRVMLKNPISGAVDTIFHGPVHSVSDLNRVEVRDYHGEKVNVVIVGFKNEVATSQVSKDYDGTQQKTVKTDTIVHAHPKILIVKPDSLTLYKGGEAGILLATPTADWAGKTIIWKSLDMTKAVVSSSGIVTPIGGGFTSIIASANDSVSDTVRVKVLVDAPVLQAGAWDTTVLINTPAVFTVKAVQDYGFIKNFAWDLDGDGKFEDSLENFPSTQKELSTKAKIYTTPGTVTARFRVTDGEGNEVSASMNVNVTGALPLPSNSKLASLSLSTGPIKPTFDSDSLTYRSFVYDGSLNTIITAVTENSKATVSVGSGVSMLRTASADIALHEGTNLISIKVVSQDGSSDHKYTVIVTVPPNLDSRP